MRPEEGDEEGGVGPDDRDESREQEEGCRRSRATQGVVHALREPLPRRRGECGEEVSPLRRGRLRGIYLRELVPIPEGVQDGVEHAVPPWLNSSMHLLNGLPALNASALNNGMPLGWRGPSPGQAALEPGRRPKHPVVIVPGFISSGLELWDGLQCGKHFFRQRMWGTPAMATAYFANRQCWMQHMRLDPVTGLDPAGIKLRAVSGLEAVDWFVPGYFVWGKVIESLGESWVRHQHAAGGAVRLEAVARRVGAAGRVLHAAQDDDRDDGPPAQDPGGAAGALLRGSAREVLSNWVEAPVSEGAAEVRDGRIGTSPRTWTLRVRCWGYPRRSPRCSAGR